MSEAKFKAPKKVLHELDRLSEEKYTIFDLFDVIGASEIYKYEQKQMIKGFSQNEIDQAIIDYVIWKKDTIELEREPHYVIEYQDEASGSEATYLIGVHIPVNVYGGLDSDNLEYHDGWPKDEAERLNKTISGKLVEVK